MTADPKKLAEEYCRIQYENKSFPGTHTVITGAFLAGWHARDEEELRLLRKIEKYKQMEARLRHVMSKGMIHVQDHHDGAALRALNEALEALG